MALVFNLPKLSFHEKFLNTEIFLVCKYLYSVQIREITDKKKPRIWTLFTQWLPSYYSLKDATFTLIMKKMEIFCVNDWILCHFYLLFSPTRKLVNVNKNIWHNTLLSSSWRTHPLLSEWASITSSTDIIMLLPDMWKLKKITCKKVDIKTVWVIELRFLPLSLPASVIFCPFFRHLLSFLAWLKK